MNILSTTTPKARKQHRCNYCYGFIEIGEVYENSSIENDGTVYTWKSHVNCQKTAEKLNMFEQDRDNGVTEDTFREYIQEEYYTLIEETSIEKIPFSQKLEFVIKHHLQP